MASGLRLLGFRCTRCGNCCRDVRVPLTGADLARLAESTCRKPGDLVEWLSPTEIDLTGEPETLVLLDRGFRWLALRQEAGACLFLDGDDRCSAYDARPIPCRTYPLVASFGRRGGVRRLRLLRGSECDFARDGHVDATALRENTRRQDEELADFARAIASWNRIQKHRGRLSLELLKGDDFVAWLSKTPTEKGAAAIGRFPSGLVSLPTRPW